MAVLNTTSPDTDTSAPNERPSNLVPSLSTRVALRRWNGSCPSSTLERRCIFPGPEAGVREAPPRLHPNLSPCSTGEGGTAPGSERRDIGTFPLVVASALGESTILSAPFEGGVEAVFFFSPAALRFALGMVSCGCYGSAGRFFCTSPALSPRAERATRGREDIWAPKF